MEPADVFRAFLQSVEVRTMAVWSADRRGRCCCLRQVEARWSASFFPCGALRYALLCLCVHSVDVFPDSEYLSLGGCVTMPLCPQRFTLVKERHNVDCLIISAIVLLVLLRASCTVRQKVGVIPRPDCLHCSLGSMDALYRRAFDFGESARHRTSCSPKFLLLKATKYNPAIVQNCTVRGWTWSKCFCTAILSSISILCIDLSIWASRLSCLYLSWCSCIMCSACMHSKPSLAIACVSSMLVASLEFSTMVGSVTCSVLLRRWATGRGRIFLDRLVFRLLMALLSVLGGLGRGLLLILCLAGLGGLRSFCWCAFQCLCGAAQICALEDWCFVVWCLGNCFGCCWLLLFFEASRCLQRSGHPGVHPVLKSVLSSFALPWALVLLVVLLHGPGGQPEGLLRLSLGIVAWMLPRT